MRGGGRTMSPDATMWSGIITGIALLVSVAAGAIRRSGLLGTVERLYRERAMVKLVRAHQQMASLRRSPGLELTHSFKGGPRLVVRQNVVERQDEEGARRDQ